MTTFPSLPEERGRNAKRQGLCSERYAFHVAGKDYTIAFWRMAYLEGSDDRQRAELEATVAFEVSFRLEDYTQPDGTVLRGYETLGTGNPFQILGGVANGIVAWAKESQPDYLYWRAHGTGRQHLYDKMIRCFVARGSGWQRLAADPFTGSPCPPEVFWSGPELPGGAQPPCRWQS